MIVVSAQKLQFVLFSSIGVLTILQLTGCDKVRVVGPSRCSGRVEIFHQDAWGTVCDDHWSMASADVVCQELSCGTALEIKKGAFFGQGKGEIWLDDVMCLGKERSILKCPHRPLGEHNCGHGEDAGVVCSEYLRIVNGSNRCNGRVEIYKDSQWKRTCSSDWSVEDGKVACREINCGSPLSHPTPPDFGRSPQADVVKTNCMGNESSISQCPLQDSNEACTDATVVCQNSKPIRLMNGTHKCSGRVEVYHNAQWGSICDDRWGMQEAAVACREMNCGSPIAVKYKSFYGGGQDQVWLDDMECTGHEKSLSDCPNRGFGEHDCDHSEDAGVECSEYVKLVNGTDQCSGRVEIFHKGHWGGVCSDAWALKEATVVCKELGCGAPKKEEGSVFFGESVARMFTGRCAQNATSISQCQLQEHTGPCDGVSLSCSGNSPIRLVNGTHQCSGRVEVLHNGQWGTVCDDEWGLKDAHVVCRAMDCGKAMTAKSNSYFGEGAGDIWLDDVKCLGNETSLMHCQHATLGENNCGHIEDAGVVCSDTIRLINGSDECSGRVEVHHGGHWLPAYNLNWGMNEASVVCKEVNCGEAVKATGSFGQHADLRGLKVSCGGRESSITQCSLREYVKSTQERLSPASVQCTGNVRLTGGSNPCNGKVEYFNNGQWGTACLDSWDMSDTTVVCQQLNCGRGYKIKNATQSGSGPLYRFECAGSESTLAQCANHLYGETRKCNATSAVGVICAGSLEVRLVGHKDDCAGRVEVQENGVWKTVCDADWTTSTAQVVCDLLECGRAASAPGGANFGQGVGAVVEANQLCFDNVTSLQRCAVSGFRTSSCGHDRDAGVTCAAQVRLAGGSSQCSGRVEILYKGQWGTVCDDEWQINNADVVCRQLGCGHAVAAPVSAHFGRGNGPIWLDNVECNGEESSIAHCSHQGFGENNCGHGEDASAICLGALEKPQISFSPGTAVDFGDRVEVTCAITTEQTGGTFILKNTQGTFQMEKFSENEAAVFAFPSVAFSQRGSYFCEYQKKLPDKVIYYPQGAVAVLTVAVKLEQPSISLTTPQAMVIYSPDKVSVTRGGTFSITCSTYSKYPGGVFSLTRSQNNATEKKPSFGHSVFYMAYFEFPSVDLQHQGDYACVYSVNLSSAIFSSSPSKSLRVTIDASASSSAVTGVLVTLLVVLIVLGAGVFAWKRRWQAIDTLVQFSSRFGGVSKQDVDERSNNVYNGRDGTSQINEHALESRFPEDISADSEVENSVERDTEYLAGKVCYESEPLVLS